MDSREKVKTALVNQKYRSSISFITLQDAAGSIELNNYKGFWTIQRLSDYTSSQFQNLPSIPAAPERVNNFLSELIKIRNLYKISDKINKNSSLGLNNGTEFHITYSITDGTGAAEGLRELIFGNQDFSFTSRYLMTGESSQVYEADGSLDSYLTTSIQSWAEPYIISRSALTADIQRVSVIFKNPDNQDIIKTGKISDREKLLELRHGGLPELAELTRSLNQNSLAELQIENGDKSRIILEIYQNPLQEGSYIIKADYFRSDSASAFYTAYLKISSWTYSKIREITL